MPYKKLVIFTISIAIVLLLLYITEFYLFYKHAPWLLLFFSGLTYFSLRFIEAFSKPGDQQFLIMYFITTGIRLVLSTALALVLLLVDRVNTLEFATFFISLYLLYLGFEIYAILSIFRLHSEKGTENAS